MTHAAGWKLNPGHDAFCDQAEGRWDGGCQCEFLAKVRADEREQARRRVEAIEPKGSPFDGGYHDGFRDALGYAKQAVLETLKP